MPAFLTGPLLKYAIIGLVIAGLVAALYVLELKLEAANARVTAAEAELGTCTAANNTIIDKLKEVTVDETTAKTQEQTAVTAETAHDSAAAATIATVEERIIHVAVPSDDACSPALAAAFHRVCPVPASDSHPGAAR